jgi:colicin import membrane protein
VKYSEPVREVKPMFREPQPAASAPPVTASIPRTKPETKLRVAGASGSSPYWNLVKARIVGFWVAPPVDIKALTVMVRFRLERDGSIGSVMIEQSSGNAYFDMAAQRAVQSAVPLPRVPADLTDSYFDTYFTFSAGEAAG